MDGGSLVAEVLLKQGVRFLFTLCGGHIAPILTGCEARNIRVVDVRHEVNAVFAADAVSRISGIPGVAAVTAGPGVTNTITAIKNAQLAQSPLILLGGASATVLRGKGSLQDIDQMALVKPHVKWAASLKHVRDIVPTLEKAFRLAQSGVPGPVFLEFPLDLLYPEDVTRSWFQANMDKRSKNLKSLVEKNYLNYHLHRIFSESSKNLPATPPPVKVPVASFEALEKSVALLQQARQPLLVIGSQALLQPSHVQDLVKAVTALNLPVYLAGMGRGLLGANHPLHMRHHRREALQSADVVILAGAPCDFRLGYGRQINAKARLIAVNRSTKDLNKNRRPTLGVHADAGRFLQSLSKKWQNQNEEWTQTLRSRDAAREEEIQGQAKETTEYLNPVQLCRSINEELPENSILVADGGDFVGTAAYTIQPRGPLRWLDPGAFGTLGVGAGFALGAKLCCPESEVWILYGDGSAGYSLSEFDTFARHELGIIAVVGNDACWTQIARDQVTYLKSDAGTRLRHTDYHEVARGFGGEGLQLKNPDQITPSLKRAQQLAKANVPCLVNALIGSTDFRKGSISV